MNCNLKIKINHIKKQNVKMFFSQKYFFIKFVFSKKATKLENHVFDISSSGGKKIVRFLCTNFLLFSETTNFTFKV